MIITEEKVLKALEALAEQDQLMLLVQIVEKWSEKRPQTSKIAFIQAQAFRKLCLLEHAWQRLRRVDETPEKKALQVEILIAKRVGISSTKNGRHAPIYGPNISED